MQQNENVRNVKIISKSPFYRDIRLQDKKKKNTSKRVRKELNLNATKLPFFLSDELQLISYTSFSSLS